MSGARKSVQPWIHSAPMDLLWILLPPFIGVAWAFSAQGRSGDSSGVSLWAWAILVVGIDVSHVYSTIYRTYFNRNSALVGPLALWGIPLAAWVIGFFLYRWDGAAFWTVMAYLAVFHFVRQQYGFMMIYARGEQGKPSRLHRRMDRFAIYMATLYPLIFWHTHLPRRFHWFVEGDFFSWLSKLPAGRVTSELVDRMGFAVFVTALVSYFLKEALGWVRSGYLNWPKNLVLLGTLASWYLGIVVLNGDLAFTVTNVVAHGVPYIALIWLLGRRSVSESSRQGWYSLRRLPLFLGLLLLLSYFEEGLWDALVWRDHEELFTAFSGLPQLSDPQSLAWVVPLLAVPQVTHYILDGFIWKLRGKRGRVL